MIAHGQKLTIRLAGVVALGGDYKAAGGSNFIVSGNNFGRMNALIVIASPGKSSFSHAMAEIASSTLARAGFHISRHDLYDEKFDPVQPTGEAENVVSDDPTVEAHCQDLRRADLILIFHPNWWSQPPAILKGWVDRVFRLGTAYGYPEGVGFDGVPVGLLRAKRALIFNTSNTAPKREREVFGDPLDSLWKTSIFSLCGVSDVERRIYGPMSNSTSTQRDEWLGEVVSLTDTAAQLVALADGFADR